MSCPFKWLCSTAMIMCASLLLGGVTPAQASDCFDHWNHRSWDGDGVSIVMCRNNSDDSKSTFISECAIHHQGGARIQGLSRHGSLDRGRVIYTDYNTNGSHFDFDIDIVCEDRGGRSYTFPLGNGNSWHDGCCRNRECGSTSCCQFDCSDEPGDPEDPEDPVDPIVVPSVDAGSPGTAPSCAQLQSREYSNSARLLDVSQGSSTRLAFNVDGVPNPAQLVFARLSLHLYDADHPGEEGTIYVNGNGPLLLPAATAWDDLDSDADVAIPTIYLTSGSNRIAFGAGTRERTYYKVSRVALTVFGGACAPVIPDAALPDTTVPDSAAPMSDGYVAQPDAWVRPVDANQTTPDADMEELDGGEVTFDVARSDIVTEPVDAAATSADPGTSQVNLDEGGFECATAPLRGGLGAVLLVGLLGLWRRRSSSPQR